MGEQVCPRQIRLNIVVICRRAGMSWREAASRLQVPLSLFADWAGGRAEIPSSAIRDMAVLWDVSADELLGLVENDWA